MVIWRILAVAMLMSVPAGQAEVSKLQEYWRMCDASAAVPLDAQHFAAADDEGNLLRVYRRGFSAPVREFDISRFLGTKKKGESDLEGAARVGNRVYWISSHGRNRDGEPAPDRLRFFATEVNGTELRPVGFVKRTLLTAILADIRFKNYELRAASMRAPKDEGGLNIEGMAARADGSLLIGFRNPVPEGKALILPLLNPADVVNSLPPRFGDMIELDLGGRGIRDIANSNDKFLLIGGARDGRDEFALFHWDGKVSSPKVVATDFRKLNPEAIFRFPDDPDGVYQVLSDDGGLRIGKEDCKKLPAAQRRFRAAEIKLTLTQ